jgi:hypothetical protein
MSSGQPNNMEPQAQIRMKNGLHIVADEGRLFVVRGMEAFDIGDLTHENLNDLEVAMNRMNQHVFPKDASFSLEKFKKEKLNV